MSRLPPPIADFLTDTKSVLDNSARLLQVGGAHVSRSCVVVQVGELHVLRARVMEPGAQREAGNADGSCTAQGDTAGNGCGRGAPVPRGAWGQGLEAGDAGERIPLCLTARTYNTFRAL